jgi:hypothetical protein
MNMTTNINANPLANGNDELERYALEECVKRQRLDHRSSVLVVPADRCELAARFARLGASVLLGDQPAQQQASTGRILAMGLGSRSLPPRPRGAADDLPATLRHRLNEPRLYHAVRRRGRPPARAQVAHRRLTFHTRPHSNWATAAPTTGSRSVNAMPGGTGDRPNTSPARSACTACVSAARRRRGQRAALPETAT